MPSQPPLQLLKKDYNNNNVTLGGLVVSVLAIGPEVRGFKPADNDGLLRAIKFRSTTSFGQEVKPSVP
jgi:hypothetical protein